MFSLLLSKARTASWANAAVPAVQFGLSKHSPVQLWLQRFASEEQQQQAELMSPARHKGVYRQGNKWSVCVTVPKTSIADSDRAIRQHICNVDGIEEAAAISDVYHLALHGGHIRPQHLNFPGRNYSSEQVAEARQVLQTKCPGFIIPTASSKKPILRPPKADRTKVQKVAAQIVQATSSYDSSTAFVGICHLKIGTGYVTHCTVQLDRFSINYQLEAFNNAAEAAVVYDLVRYNLYGPEYTMNFPPHIYTDSDAAVVRQDMQHRNPDMFAVAVRSAAKRPPSKYQLIMAGKTFDAATEAVATAEKGSTVVYSMRGVSATSSRFSVDIGEALVNRQSIRHRRNYASSLTAAVAVDAIRQALGRGAVNLPASITAAAVPAAEAWLEINRTRLTVEKQQWAAKAATLGPAQHSSK